MSEFTKGPWSINKTGIHHNNPSLENIEITYGEIGECICDTVYEEANAHLIAAAPDMYEVLEDIVKNYECEFHIDKMIRKVLAKARGEL